MHNININYSKIYILQFAIDYISLTAHKEGKWLGSPPFISHEVRPFRREHPQPDPEGGLTITMVINHHVSKYKSWDDPTQVGDNPVDDTSQKTSNPQSSNKWRKFIFALFFCGGSVFTKKNGETILLTIETILLTIDKYGCFQK